MLHRLAQSIAAHAITRTASPPTVAPTITPRPGAVPPGVPLLVLPKLDGHAIATKGDCPLKLVAPPAADPKAPRAEMSTGLSPPML